ncbi:MAG: hypothetical protein UW37_C0001G0011 [Candidatus Gottesmanbacteria bacterium GW2011_GWA2_44_17]|uniref:Uncharacterized protein n=1 Tax=Candidatus Gottesmanbacteria bacterium GW2011_GWA2_44_17 TaxID=1618444 RepID=A0A0G1HLD5_9BACT|nr:MAG: hypothetical protein UW37_C0001G0011 [Candidatus Gottesmanbacteria bacterium GW2011_GWA2_44_17]
MKKFLYRSILFLFVFSQLSYLFLAELPKIQLTAHAAGNLTSASATLSNSRLSFYGRVNGTHSAGDTTIALDASGNPDNSTNHLFPNDTVSVGPNGNFTVGSVIDSLNFALSAGLTVGASDQDAVYSTQSGALAVTFTITNDIPANGYVLVTIPDPAANGNDGAPDTAATPDINGFDLNSMATSDIATTGGTGCVWSTETLTAGSGSGHKYKVLTTSACTAGAITVTFDGASKDLVNPAPPTAHSQGTADTYTIVVDTYDGDPDSGGQIIDYANVKVAPIEGVLVSATVDESLSFTVAGITADSGSYCGVTRTAATPDTTAYSIPWGTIPSVYAAATHNTEQQLTVSTNALSGYKVYIEENDQMGRNGNVCTGATPSAGDFTFSAGTCIRDTLCAAGACSHTTSADWTDMATYVGFGYSLEDQSGTDAQFEYDDSGTWQAKTPADQEAPETRSDSNAEIMTSGVPVSGSSVFACYRIAIGGTQPAGYYYNKIKYTAVATF